MLRVVENRCRWHLFNQTTFGRSARAALEDARSADLQAMEKLRVGQGVLVALLQALLLQLPRVPDSQLDRASGRGRPHPRKIRKAEP